MNLNNKNKIRIKEKRIFNKVVVLKSRGKWLKIILHLKMGIIQVVKMYLDFEIRF